MPPSDLPPDAVCVCGHEKTAHEHYRRGSDCSLCDCPKFRRRGLGLFFRR